MNSFEPLIKSVESYLWLILLIAFIFIFQKQIAKILRGLSQKNKNNTNKKIHENKIEVFVENEEGSFIRKRYDEKTFKLKEEFNVENPYPYNYGFVIGTKENNGDAIDCYILSEKPLETGKYFCEPIGMIEMIEDNEQDNKVIMNFDSREYDVMKITNVIKCYIMEIFKNFPDVIIEFGKTLDKNETIEYIDVRKI
jgi:inorganic pyrophosphatase